MSDPVALPRLVATDLDGTLVRSDGTVSDRTVEVLAACEEIGVPVVFVTGRPLRWAADVFEHVGGHGLSIVSNGALVWDVARSRPVLQRPIEADVVLEVAARIRAVEPESLFAIETLAGFATEPGFVPHHVDLERFDRPHEGDLADLVDTEPVLKLLARRHDADPDAYVAAADAVVADLVNVTHSAFPLLEISAKEVTKASTLALVAADLGVGPQDVIAFGDQPNDLPMLDWAHHSYAMADAHPEVVRRARHLAPGHDDDGVARVLSEVFGLGGPAG